MKVRIQKINPAAREPKYANPGDACFDLHALMEKNFSIQVSLNYPAIVDTGLAFEVPEGHVMLIFSRSGHGFKSNVRLANCVGVIDSGYRGEVKVKLTSDDPHSRPFTVEDGDRIAQAMILPIEEVSFELVDDLSASARGTDGFGSSGQ